MVLRRRDQGNEGGNREINDRAQVTLLLLDARNGDSHALDRLLPIVYDELRRFAAHYLRDERAADTLQPTALVHEAYMRLVAQDMPDWNAARTSTVSRRT